MGHMPILLYMEKQTIYANFERVAGEMEVWISASDWTPDHMGLKEVVSKQVDLDKMKEDKKNSFHMHQRLGTAVFDTDAEKLISNNVEIDLQESIEEEYGL